VCVCVCVCVCVASIGRFCFGVFLVFVGWGMMDLRELEMRTF